MTDTQENFDNLTNALLEVCEECDVEGMSAEFVGYVAIQFFTEMLRDCAPTPEAGKQLVLEAVEEFYNRDK